MKTSASAVSLLDSANNCNEGKIVVTEVTTYPTSIIEHLPINSTITNGYNDNINSVVWVTEGITQHAAILLDDTLEEKVFIRWTSSNTTAWVQRSNVAFELTPRRRKSLEQQIESKNITETTNSNFSANKANSISTYPTRTSSIESDILTNEKTNAHNNQDIFDKDIDSSQDSKNSMVDNSPKFRDDDDDLNFTLSELPHRPSQRSNPKKRKRVSLSPDVLEKSDVTTTGNYCRQTVDVTSWEQHILRTPQNTTIFNGEKRKSTEVIDLSYDESPDAINLNIVYSDFTSKDFSTKFNNLYLPTKQIDNANKSSRISSASSYLSEIKAFECHDTNVSSTTLHATKTAQTDLEFPTVESKEQLRAEQYTEIPEYSISSSAYLQNLTEICFSIQNDIRWRVYSQKTGSNQDQLFDWKFGDDLSVVSKLATLHCPLLTTKSRAKGNTFKCNCILCSIEDEVTAEVLTDTPSDKSIDLPIINISMDDSERELEIRNVYLYCRLFYRKGPWFRIDDIYQKYYSPKQRPLNEYNHVDATNDHDGIETAIKQNKKENFFIPADLQPMPTQPSVLYFDEILLTRHIDRIVDLFVDLKRLLAIGWIRSFIDESECGKTVGLNLLTAEERRKVLSELGGGSNKKNAPPRKFSHPGTTENEILKQMTRQQTLGFSGKSSNEEKAKLLPVIQFVNDIVLNRLIQTIIQRSLNVDYVPVSVMKSKVASVRSSIVLKFLTAGKYSSNFLENILMLPMCFRLREKPTLTLRRYCRLYICATSGPGDMRSDGLNAWRSLLDNSKGNSRKIMTPLAKSLPPPGEETWHQLQYPGLSYRFGLKSFYFMNAYKFHHVNEFFSRSENIRHSQVFTSYESFHAWEISVELRANVDYLIEVNEMLRYNQRRRDKGKEVKNEYKESEDGKDSVDFLGLLAKEGRTALIQRLLASIEIDCLQDTILLIDSQIELHQATCNNECERVLSVIGILSIYVLCACNKYISLEQIQLISDRPWLRHLFWPGCLSYILWDIFPMFERQGIHCLAIQSLEVMLYGNTSNNFDPGQGAIQFPAIGIPSKLAPILLSRRARGKAFDRLIIDCNHLHRHSFMSLQDKAEKIASNQVLQANVVNFCTHVIRESSQMSSIGFAAIRTLARRLKQSLATTVTDTFCLEGTELGLRYKNEYDECIDDKKYSDWTPITDFDVANSLASVDNNAGSRCAFIGFEEELNYAVAPTSLNVEELAMEYYKTGRLPLVDNDSSECKGGWNGFHDEGGHIRALFRIMCSAPILGMDWGCGSIDLNMNEKHENATIHISPYQDAPFDLHVGFELKEMQTSGSNHAHPSRGFYCRRQERILKFLDALSLLTSQQLCDYVYTSILSRLRFVISHNRKDPSIERDVVQVRTLSLIAAGCGGRQLASIFRCLFFDYRHYSGGLPDLLLVRALYDDNGKQSTRLVDLKDWIGEKFLAGDANGTGMSNILIDKDDEFLGCNKVGDSGGRTNRSTGRMQTNREPKILSMDMLGEKLSLEHKEMKIFVQCMMVEVKSSNDRLDPRQEDWLNILAIHGNARVCKFQKGKTSNTK